MTAGLYDFVIEQGTDFSKTFQWLQPTDTPGELVPVNLSGFTGRSQIRDDRKRLLVDFNVSGTVTVDPLVGKVTLTLPNAITSALKFDTGNWDLKLTSPGSTKSRLIQGVVQLSDQETV